MLINEGLEVLDEDECWRLVGTKALGRVGVTIAALPAIFPVNYAVVGRTVVFRTGAGTKLRAALEHNVIAFEVDDGDALYHEGWSVLLVGVGAELDSDEVTALGPIPVAPWAPGNRRHYVRISPELVSGRRIVHGA